MALLARLGAPLLLLLVALPALILSTQRELICFAIALPLLSVVRLATPAGAPPSLGLLAGALTPLCAWLGSSFTLLIALTYVLLICPRRVMMSSLLWASPLLAYLGGSALSETALALPALLTISIDSITRLHDIALSLITTQAPSWMYLTRVTIFALMVGALTSNRHQRDGYITGALYGCAIAGLFATLSRFAGIALPSQTAFWTSLNRISGTMSDPNALGIMLGLALWLVALIPQSRGDARWKNLLVVGAIVGGGLVAGSRTFFIAACMLIITLVWRFSRRVTFLLLGLGILSIAVISILDTSTSTVSSLVTHQAIPETIRRTIASLSISRVEESLFSRGVFLSISSHMIEGFPLFGVGPDRYRGYVGFFAERLHLPIAGWTDNSNNLYLGIIAELGFTGALAFLLSAYGRKVVPTGVEPLGLPLILAISILFLTGPHTDFPEVLALIAALVALTTTARENPLSAITRSATLFLALGCIAPLLREGGVFNWHREVDSLSRWLSPHARIILPCEPSPEGGVARITVQPEYIPSREPLHVTIRGGATEVALDLANRGEKAASLPCDPQRKTISVTVDTTPPWSPYRAWPGTNDDHRLLGAQQLIRLSPETVNIQP